MADLYNLLDELEEAENYHDDVDDYHDDVDDVERYHDANVLVHDNHDDDNAGNTGKERPSLAGTEATEPLSNSSGGSSTNDDDDNEEQDENPEHNTDVEPDRNVNGNINNDDAVADTVIDDVDMDDGWNVADRQDIGVPEALKEAMDNHNDNSEQNFDETENGDGLFDIIDDDYDDYENAEFDKQRRRQQQHYETNEIYERLHHHWVQERQCPELLAYDDEIVELLKEEMQQRQEWIDELEEYASAADPVQAVLATVSQMDLDRIKFMLSDWLSCRLEKIESHPLHMRDKVDYMSDAEIEYLKQYGALLEQHLHQTVIDHIPAAWQALDDTNMIDTPDYTGYHFWSIKETIDTGDVVHEKGTSIVAKYDVMREYMVDGKVEIQL